MGYGDTARVIPAERSAVVMEMHVRANDDSETAPTSHVNVLPVLYWVERLQWVKTSEAINAPRTPHAQMYPVTPGIDGIPASYEQCGQVVGWIVVHGMLTMDELRFQLRQLAFSATADIMGFFQKQGYRYELMIGIAETNPSGVLNRSGIWVGDDDNTAAEINRVSSIIADLWDSAPVADIDDLPISDDLRQLVIA